MCKLTSIYKILDEFCLHLTAYYNMHPDMARDACNAVGGFIASQWALLENTDWSEQYLVEQVLNRVPRFFSAVDFGYRRPLELTSITFTLIQLREFIRSKEDVERL